MNITWEYMESSKLDIEMLIKRVLQDNKGILCIEDEETEKLFEEVLKQYCFKFFTLIKKKSPKMTYGLQLGITKHFCDFCIKNYTELGLCISKEKVKDYFNAIIPPAASMVACLDNSGLAVYAIIKELKICIYSTANINFL